MTDGAYAVLSCDLDTVDRHLAGYGIDGAAPCEAVYRRAVPRILTLLDEVGARAVFFVIAEDAARERGLLRELVAAGHEVASHSWSHPQPFRTLDDARLRREVADSRARLADAAGADVVGFRAPAWDVDERVLRAVSAAGYRYDASVFPTPALLAVRLAAWRRSAGGGWILSMDALRHALSPAHPHASPHVRGLAEFPIGVTPWLRVPVYHTFTFTVPPWVSARALRALLRSRRPVCYEFHGADLLDLAQDGVDPRIARHPGMRRPLAGKRAGLRDILARIAAARRVLTYRQALDARLVPSLS